MFKYTENLYRLACSCSENEAIPDKFSGTNYAENKLIKDLLSEAGKINSLVDSNKIYWNFLFEGKTKAELVNYGKLGMIFQIRIGLQCNEIKNTFGP